MCKGTGTTRKCAVRGAKTSRKSYVAKRGNTVTEMSISAIVETETLPKNQDPKTCPLMNEARLHV